MGLAGTIYEQAPRPNPMGQALQQSAQHIADTSFKAAQLKRQQDEQLATLTMQFLPKLANNPEMMRQFTSHPDFGRILGAFERVGLRSLFTRDPKSGAYSVSIPPDVRSVDELAGEAIQSQYGDDPMATLEAATEYKVRSMDPYMKALQTRNAQEEFPSATDAGNQLELEDELRKREEKRLRAELRTKPGAELRGGWFMPKRPKYRSALQEQLASGAFGKTVDERVSQAVKERRPKPGMPARNQSRYREILAAKNARKGV